MRGFMALHIFKPEVKRQKRYIIKIKNGFIIPVFNVFLKINNHNHPIAPENIVRGFIL